MILLDTNVCIGILRGDQTVLANYLKQEGNVAVSFMTAAELFYGAEKSQHPQANRALVEEFLDVVPTVHSTENIVRRFGSLKAQLSRAGKIVEDADVFIAATAMETNSVLATNNVKHMSRFGSLVLENWFQP